MEWVETTGRTVDEAKDAALDQLGVDEQDAEFEVLAEPKGGLFGRLRAEARVRARVRPTTPRAKEERGRRRRGSNTERTGRDTERSGRDTERSGRGKRGGSGEDTGVPDKSSTSVATMPRRQAARGNNGRASGTTDQAREVPEMTLAEQAEVGREFLQGLVAQFEATAQVAVEPVDDDTIRLAVTGSDLGLLIGPKGQTLQAIQELVRTVVQRHTTSREGWLVVDVAQYRQKRKAALERFAAGVSAQVLETAMATVLEPMSAADRKIVHDAVNDIDGVTTRSEGEEPRRSVVIAPDADGD
jgi:spoIIIJ-associated protein